MQPQRFYLHLLIFRLAFLSRPSPFLAPLPSHIPAGSSTFNPLRLLAGVRLVQTDRFSLSLSRRAKDQIRYIPHRRNPMMIYIALYSTLDPSNRSSISLARIPRCIECLVETLLHQVYARRSEKKFPFIARSKIVAARCTKWREL